MEWIGKLVSRPGAREARHGLPGQSPVLMPAEAERGDPGRSPAGGPGEPGQSRELGRAEQRPADPGRAEPGQSGWTMARVGRMRAREAAEDDGWRRVYGHVFLGGQWGGTERDLSPARWRDLLVQAYTAYCTNPLAYAVIEQCTNFVLGGGVRAVARDPRVQRAIDRFWYDPENRMDERVYAIQTELSLFGEQFIRFFVDPLTGRTVIRQLDPLYVEAIETDPDDVERPIRYLYVPPLSAGPWPADSGDSGGPLGERARMAGGSGGASGAGAAGGVGGNGEWLPAAEVAHFAINKVTNALRGRSDLATLLPWLRSYADWLDDRVRLNRFKGAFIYDVTVQGARKSDLDQLRAEYAKAPAPGTVLFHNDSETWRAVQPQIGADDAMADGRALRLMVATGAGVPEHYLSEGGQANRATAAEMGLPAIKRFQRRQEYLRGLIAHLVERALAEQVRAGRLGPRVDRRFTVEFEELVDARPAEFGTALSKVTGALANAADRGWVTPDEARRLWWRFAGEGDGQGSGGQG